MTDLLNIGFGWVDAPLIDGIDYFTAIFAYFFKQATTIAKLFGVLGIVWTCIQLMFATMAVRKAITDVLLKCIMFTIIMVVYEPSVVFIQNTVTNWGLNAGNAKENLTEGLGKLHKHLEFVINDSENKWFELNYSSLVTAATNDNMYTHGLELAEARRKALNDLKLKMNYKPSGNDANDPRTLQAKKTKKALESILKIDDKQITRAYFLDLSLKINNKETGFLSPSSLLRLALFTGEVIQARNSLYITDDSENSKKVEKKNIKFIDSKLEDLTDWFLSFICYFAVILAGIFATIQYVMCVLEFTLIGSIGIVFVPFMLFDGTKDFAHKLIPALSGLAIKLLVITLCMLFAFSQYINLASMIIMTGSFNGQTFSYVMFVILLSWILTQNAPQIAVTLLTGNPQLSMGEVVQAVGTAAGIGAATATLAPKAAKTSGSVIRGGVNAARAGVGAVAEMAGAGSAAFNDAKASGSNAFGATGAGVWAGAKQMPKMVGQSAQNAVHNFLNGKSGANGGALNLKDANLQSQMSRQDYDSVKNKPEVAQRNMSGMKTDITEKDVAGNDIFIAQRQATIGEQVKNMFNLGERQFLQSKNKNMPTYDPHRDD